MQSIHRISISSTPEIRGELAAMGVVVGASGLVTFEVDEAHEAWPALQAWIARREAVDIVSTKFSKKELADARWLALEPSWHCGYPQPDEERFGYRETTYDLADGSRRILRDARGLAQRLQSEWHWLPAGSRREGC